MSDRRPYTYFVQHLPTGFKYYGSKYGKGADPQMFWKQNGYFTSSTKIAELIREYGTDSFKAEVRKVFETPDQALDYEYRFLKKVDALNKKDEWLNANLGGKKFRNVGPASAKTLEAQRNKRQTPEGNARRSAALKGRVVTNDTKRLMSEVQHNRPKEKEEARRSKIRERATGRLHNSDTKLSISKIVSQTRWIKKDGEQKKVNLSDLEQYIKDGWSKGRIFTTVTCPHCGATGVKHNISRQHFDKCKHKGK